MWKTKPVKEPDKHIAEYWSDPRSREGLSEFKATNKPSKKNQICYIKMKNFRELRRQAKCLNCSKYDWFCVFTVYLEPSQIPGGLPPRAKTAFCVSVFYMHSKSRFPELSKHSELYIFKSCIWLSAYYTYVLLLLIPTDLQRTYQDSFYQRKKQHRVGGRTWLQIQSL